VSRAADIAVDPGRRPLVRLVLDDPDPRVRAIALTLVITRESRPDRAYAWKRAARDADARVRLRAAQLAPKVGRAVPSALLLELLGDADAWIAEAAAYAAGEHPRPSRALVNALAAAATSHEDALVRESAVAALGAHGDPATLAAVLAACDDKPAIRRRAIVALAAFDGDAATTRVRAALEDHDWQVRQIAEDLLRATP
jgi:hypothetical protein